MESPDNTTPEPEPGDAPVEFDAFISYRHVEPDRTWANWLHHALETYRVPRKLAAERNLPRRLKKVFQDEQELPASPSLDAEIKRALQRSKFLIVVCSPRTPLSPWVNLEAQYFRELGRHDRILALLIEGHPQESFPQALCEIRRTVVDARGVAAEQVEQVEPLAADVRPSRPEPPQYLKRMARLRMLACILGVRFDDLRRREQERQTRRMLQVGALLLTLLTVVTGLAIVAVVQRNDAKFARGVAETKRVEAEQERDKVARQLALTLFDRGDSFARRGDVGTGLLWFARAIQNVPPGAADLDELFRRNIAAWQARLPTPIADIVLRDPVRRIAVNRQGTRLATSAGLPDDPPDSVRLWDLARNLPVGGALRHGADVNALAFSPDGALLATASDDGAARLWRVDAAGELAFPPLKHAERGVSCLAFSRDGERLLTGGEDNTARLWDARTGEQLGPPIEAGNTVSSVAYSPDGGRLFVGCGVRMPAGGMSKLYDARTREPLFELDDSTPALAAQFSPDGRWLALGVGAFGYRSPSWGRIAFWDVIAKKVVAEPLAVNDPVTSVDFSFDGGVALSGDKSVRLWRPAVGRVVSELGEASGLGAGGVFSPDGRLALTLGDNPRLWETLTATPLAPRLRQPTRAAAFTSDGGLFVLAGDGPRSTNANNESVESGRLRIWRSPPTSLASPLPDFHGWPDMLAFSADGAHLIAQGGRITRRQVDALMIQRAFPSGYLKPGERVIGASPDGRFALVGGNPAARIARVGDGAGIGRPLPFSHAAAAFSPDGSTLLTGADKGVVQLWDCRTGFSIGPAVQHPGPIDAVTFSADGARFLTLCVVNVARDFSESRGEVRLFHTDSPDPRTEPLTQVDSAKLAAFNADGTRVLTVTAAAVRLWNAADAKPVGLPIAPDGGVRSAHWTADGKSVLVDGMNGLWQLWDAADAKPIAPPVQAAAGLNPGEGPILSGAGDRVLINAGFTADVYDTATGRLACPPLEHRRGLACAAFSADARRVLTGSADGIARIWDLADGKLQATLPHARESTVKSVAFSPDDRLCFTVVRDRFDNITAQLWDVGAAKPVGPPLTYREIFGVPAAGAAPDAATPFPIPAPVPGDPRQIQRQVESRTGLELDPAGGVRELDDDEWKLRESPPT